MTRDRFGAKIEALLRDAGSLMRYEIPPFTQSKRNGVKKIKPAPSEAKPRGGGGNRKGVTLSPETRAKISAGNKGKHTGPRGPMSEETKRKISEATRGERCVWYGKTHGPEARQKLREAFSGERNPHWRGGVKEAPYCPKFNNEFKERVRNFFGRKCVGCGAAENGRKLSVHHVNFHKGACCADGVLPLFVPLCASCHSKTNTNREHWEARFTALINEQHGGRCYLPRAPKC